MPYRRDGNIIYHKVGDHWKIKQRCASIERAKAALRLLEGLYHKEKKRS